MIRCSLKFDIARRFLDDLAACSHVQLGDTDSAVVSRLEKLRGVNLPIFLGSDFDFSINQTDINILNARLALEVLLHPICSKVSCHAFDPHLDMFDLCLQFRHKHTTEQQQHCEIFSFHRPSFSET